MPLQDENSNKIGISKKKKRPVRLPSPLFLSVTRKKCHVKL